MNNEISKIWTYDEAVKDFEKRYTRTKNRYIDYLLSPEKSWHDAIYFRFTDCPVDDRLVFSDSTVILFHYDHDIKEFINIPNTSLYTQFARMLEKREVTIPDILSDYNFVYEKFYSSNEIYLNYFLIKDIDKFCNKLEELVKKEFRIEQIIKNIIVAA
ncbi:hypothetical protein WJR50_18910 [Catalinimonas sp. 4WD22]|uniref:hypothetical protein n=1 Tax=Catalinimonas locisalis TaxID=3133978 RepID=UPI003100F4C6